MKYLFVVAHCDDELLGAGAIIHKLSKDNEVYIHVLCSSGFNRESDVTNKCLEINKELGVKEYFFSNYDGLKMDKFSHVEIVSQIEKIIMEVSPDIVITHYERDMNKDHQIVSEACKVACRLPQRETIRINPIKELWYMEEPSATEWGGGFEPNIFIEVEEEDIDVKIRCLSEYDGVLRSNKHPRGISNISALAKVRGCTCGCEYAEAFMLGFRII